MYNKEVVYTLALVVSLLILYNSQKRRQSLASLLAPVGPPRLMIGNKIRFGVKLDQGSQSISISNIGTQISTSNQPVAIITSDGKVGIGTTVPSASLHVQDGDIEVDSIEFQNTTLSGLSSIRLGTSTTTDMVVSGNAYLTGTGSRIGIGTTSPQYTLDATSASTFNLGKAIKTVPRSVSHVTYNPFLSTGTFSSPSNGGIITFTSATRYGTIVIDPSVSTSKKVQITIQASSTSVSVVPSTVIPTITARYVKVRFSSLNGLQKNIALSEIKVYDNTLTNVVTTDTVTSTSSILSNFVSRLVTDNDPSTFWHPATDANPWIQLDLGSDRPIHMISITVRNEPILYSRQLGMVVDCISSAGSVVYTSTPAHSPTGSTTYAESGSDGYPYYYYVPALGTATNGSFVSPIVEPMVLCPVPIPPHPSVKLSYEKTYFVIHDGKSVLYTSPYLTGNLTTYKTPPLTRAPNTTKLFMAIVGEKNVSIHCSVAVSDYSIALDGQLIFPLLPFRTDVRQMIIDGNSLANQYGPHTFALISSLPAYSLADKKIHCLFDADEINQCASIQSTVDGGYPLVINPRGGNVGIGKASPVTGLEVNGKVKSGYRYSQMGSYNLTRVDDNDKWLKIASFTGPTYGEFLLSWATPGDHGEVRFNASCAFNNHNVINILGITLYNAEFDWIRISTDNTSIYNTNYIEVHVRQGAWYWDTVTLHVNLLNVGPISGGLTVFPVKTPGTSTGYTYYATPTIASFTSQLNAVNMFFNGNLGIGTVTPSSTIEVTDNSKYLTTRLQSNASDTAFELVNSSGEGWRISSSINKSAQDGTMLFQKVDGVTAVVIAPNGNMGIGTTNPQSRLEVFSTTESWGNITSRVITRGESAAGMRLLNDVGGCYWFLNSSTRTADGGANLMTLRNDVGGLRLQNASERCTILMNGTSTSSWSDMLNINAATTISGSSCVVNAPTTFSNGLTINGSSLTVNAETTINNITSITITGSNFTVNGSSSFNRTSIANGKLVIMNSTNSGSSRGIWLWTAEDSNWGIYMADSSAGTAMNGNSAPAGSGFASFAMRFRVYNSASNGIIFENSSNQLLASIKASDGDTYFKTLWTKKIDFNRLYANNWFRHTSSKGIRWDDYNQHLQATLDNRAMRDSFYRRRGTIYTYGAGRNEWPGYSIGDWGSFMAGNGPESSTAGIHYNGKGWMFHCDAIFIFTQKLYFYGYYIYIGGTHFSTITIAYWSSAIQFTSYNYAKLDDAVFNSQVSIKDSDGTNDLDINGDVRVSGAYNMRSWSISPSTNSYQLQFNSDWGQVSTMSVDGSWWRGSDLRIKTDIKPLNKNNSLKTILGIQPVSYLHTNLPLNQQRTVGFVAQQVQAVNPYCVSEQEYIESELEMDSKNDPIPMADTDGNPITDKYGAVKFKTVVKKTDKKLGVCYEDLYIHSINVIQSQQREIEAKKERIQRLTDLISYQNSLIQKLNLGLIKLEGKYFSY